MHHIIKYESTCLYGCVGVCAMFVPGSHIADSVLTVLLGTSMLVDRLVGFVLHNTVAGYYLLLSIWFYYYIQKATSLLSCVLIEYGC